MLQSLELVAECGSAEGIVEVLSESERGGIPGDTR